MPSASMYMQLNFITIKARHFNALNYAARRATISPITNKLSKNSNPRPVI
jgi:hypothetical protein